mgnify:CR=1 FL=1
MTAKEKKQGLRKSERESERERVEFRCEIREETERVFMREIRKTGGLRGKARF